MKLKHKWYRMKAMKSWYSDQEGMVSIIVTVIVLTVLTLIVVGFSTLTRREQQQSLDKQLSSQAFYAAESGINDVRKVLVNGLATKTSCGGIGGFKEDGTTPVAIYAAASQLNLSGNVSISCLLVNDQVTDLEYSDLNVNNSEYIPITSATPISSITISWNAHDQTQVNYQPTGATNFPPAGGAPGDWVSNSPLMRVALTNLAAGLDRTSLSNNTFTSFFYPNADPATPTPNGAVTFTTAVNQQGQIVNGHCNQYTDSHGNTKAKQCNVIISGLGGNNYFLRLTPYYTDGQATITATDTSGNPVIFQGAQVQIDATGKAQDVLRRIQVRVPVNTNFNSPEFALNAADGICKRLEVAPPNLIDDVTGVPASGDPNSACQLP